MAGLLPRFSMEPAPGYLPFVESHLATLRGDAERLTGDGSIAEEVSSGALTDVALRWYWFELLRVGLRQPDPAGAFLGVALHRRCASRQSGPAEVWADVEVYADDPPSRTARWTPRATSVAVRLAKVGAAPPPTPSAVLEAVIAWLHAYKTYVRYCRVAAAVVAVIVVLLLAELRNAGAGS